MGLAHLKRRAKTRSRPFIRIVNLHGTPADYQEALDRQVSWVLGHFSPIDPQRIEEAWSEEVGSGRPLVLFTFDDGLANNYYVAAPVLEKHGVRGLFFVCASFAMSSGESSKRFYEEKLKPTRARQYGTAGEHWTAMGPGQIRELAQRGHEIGNHTFSHIRLSGAPREELVRQIVTSQEVLASWTGYEIRSFAWPLAWNAIDGEAWEIARQRHRLCFAPCGGLVDPSIDTLDLLWRTNVEAWYSTSEYRFMYCGLGDPACRLKRRALRALRASGGGQPRGGKSLDTA